eukprot:TRINITY_DN66145_c0_g1_i1.p3 TRINITY_DN66145_c0_g1~~TRINITY_DN66145_c0_g1_i1.p3  ORF type:complete len:102 (+),score=15.69 TRINITY_DN66145_c0_g1_i1:43-306(+)
MMLSALWVVLLLTIGRIQIASTQNDRHEEGQILMLRKQNGVDGTTITRKPASWMSSSGSFGSEPEIFSISRKLRQQALGADFGESDV